jgi:hypothetical protein
MSYIISIRNTFGCLALNLHTELVVRKYNDLCTQWDPTAFTIYITVKCCVFNHGQVVWFMGVVVDASVADGFGRVVSSCYADIWCWMYLVVSRC